MPRFTPAVRSRGYASNRPFRAGVSSFVLLGASLLGLRGCDTPKEQGPDIQEVQQDTDLGVKHALPSEVTAAAPEKAAPAARRPISEFVRRIFKDARGDLWLGTNGDGVFRRRGNTLEQFSTHNGFGGVAVRGIKEDKQGNVWFGTDGGLSKWSGESFTNYTTADGLVHNDVWGLAIDRKGTIWIGTLGGVSRFDGVTFATFDLPKSEPDYDRGVTSDAIVYCIMEDSQGRLWFGNNGGALVYDGATLESISVRDGLCSDAVNCILEDGQGRFWFATHHNGVCRMDKEGFTHFGETHGVRGTEAWDVGKDSDGNIWFSVEQHGLYRYDGKDFVNFHTSSGLDSGAVQCAFEDRDGTLWAGAFGGLYRFDGKSFIYVSKEGPWE